MSVEFEEQDSATRDAYRQLGQGVKIFHDPLDADIDIIAIPGLGTDPTECWTYHAGKNSSATDEHGIESQVSKSQDSSKGFNWIRDSDGLAKLFPKARIMLYDYASAWNGRFKVRATMKSICLFLLEDLNEIRRDSVIRPLIFIGHSMGGVVIAKALAIARARKEYEFTLTCTMGCAFFGVPFKGSNMAQLALLYSATFGHDAYEGLLSFIKAERNDVLDEVTDEFIELSKKVNPPMEIFCVWETYPTAVSYTRKALKNMPALLQNRFFKTGAEKLLEVGISALGGSTHFVSKESACLMGTHSIGLGAGHSDLVQFESLDHPKFQQIKTQLHKMVQQTKYNGRRRAVLSGQNLSSQVFVKTVQRSLQGVDMRSKYHLMLSHLPATSWLLSEDSYRKWLDHRRKPVSYLWLTGAAGLGKTNACLAALQQLDKDTTEKQEDSSKTQIDTFLAFFICERSIGSNTAEELLKSLITQLIAQDSSLAQHARWFISDASAKTANYVQEANTQTGARATATVDNLWKCLQDMMEDPVVDSMYIVISNLHYLQLTESTTAFLNKLAEHAGASSEHQSVNRSIKWLVSSRREQQFTSMWQSGHIYLIDLDNAQYGAKIKDAREKHAKAAVSQLKTAKKYTHRLAWYVSNTIHSQSLDETWIDVVCILLSAKPAQSSDVEVRNWLNHVGQFNMDQLIDYAWESILQASENQAAHIKDLMQVLTITYEAPSIADLVVLTGIDDHEFILELIKMCSPMLRMGVEGEAKDKVCFTNAEFARRLHSTCYGGRQHREHEERQRHGLIALSCFQYIKEFYSSGDHPRTLPRITAKTSLSRSSSVKKTMKRTSTVFPSDKSDTDEVSKDSGAFLEASHARYPAKYLFKHLSGGLPDVVQELCEEDVDFWGQTSHLRDLWLKEFRETNPDLKDLTSEGMSALHIAAGIGADELLSSLVDNNGKESLAWTSVDGSTPLHIAAHNNHINVVETLLRRGADIEAGQNGIGTPLHFAALQGNAAILGLLIEKGANVNAYSQTIGPVINAAIRSGTVDAVNKIMTADVRFADDYTKCPAPLSLSAGYSKPELFKDILNFGREKWLQNVKLIDRALVEAATSGHLQSVQTLLDFPHVYTNDTLEDAINCAAREVNWAPAETLLDFAIADAARGNRRWDARLDEVFYLAVAGRDERLGILKKIWASSRQYLQQSVIDFSLYEATALRKAQTAHWLVTACKANPNASSLRPKVLKQEYTNVASSVDYRTTLNAAASTGNASFAEVLIKHGASVDGPGCYALQLAAAEGHPETVKALLANGAAISRKVEDSTELGFYSGTALQAACDNNKAVVVELLIGCGADPNLGGGAFNNPITSATQRGLDKILKMLLASDTIDVNVTNVEDQSTPLINAAAYMDLESLRALLAKGAAINVENAAGDTALILAAAKGKQDCLRHLCDHGANVIHRSPTRGVPITVAADALQPDCVRILAEIMVETIERYSAQEPKLQKTISEHQDELTDLRVKYNDAKQHRDNLQREIESHKRNSERLQADGDAQAAQNKTWAAQVQAQRVQLYATEDQLHRVTEQHDRAQAQIAEVHGLLEREKTVNDTLRQRDGWKELQAQIEDAAAKLSAELTKSAELESQIKINAAALETSSRERQSLHTDLVTTKQRLEETQVVQNGLEAALGAAKQENQSLTAQVGQLRERLATISAFTGQSASPQSPPINIESSFSKMLPTEPIEETYEMVSKAVITETPLMSSPNSEKSEPAFPSAPQRQRPTPRGSRSSNHFSGTFRTIHGQHRADGSIGGYAHQIGQYKSVQGSMNGSSTSSLQDRSPPPKSSSGDSR